MRRQVARTAALRHFPVHLAVTTAAIAQPLLQMYGENLAVFTTANLDGARILAFMAVVVLVPAVVLTALETAISLAVPRWQRGAHLATVWIAATALAALLMRSAPLGPWPSALGAIAATGAAITAAYARLPAIGQWLRWMSPLSVAVAVLFTLAAREVIWVPDVEAIDVEVTQSTVLERTTAPGDVSVLWFVLDEFSVSSLMTPEGEINAERFPGFAALAATSTWYRNNLTVSKDTIEAVPAMLTGRYPEMGRSPTLATYPENLFTITAGQLAMDVNETITRLCPRDQCRYQAVSGGDDIANPDASIPEGSDVTVLDTDRPDLAGFLRDASVVLGHKLLPAGLRDRLPAIDEGWGDFGGADGGGYDDESTSVDDPATSTTVSDGTGGDETDEGVTVDTIEDEKANSRPKIDQPARFRAVVKRAAEAALPTLHFVHLMIPHKPWFLAPDLRRYDWLGQYDPGFNPKSTDRVRDEYGAYLYQVAATDRLVGEMVESLKRSANWDRTMIIVTSDHGQTFEPGLSKRRTINASRPESLEDIYRPPLFVKYPDQTSGRVDDCAVQSIDILPTVLAAKGLAVAVAFDGVDLATTCPDRPVRTVRWAKKSAELTTGVDALLARVRRMDEFVPHTGDTSSIVAAGPYRDLLGRSVTATPGAIDPISTWTVAKRSAYASVSGQELETVPMEISGKVGFSSDLPDGAWVAVTLNGRIAGFLGELNGAKDGQTLNYRSLLDYAQLTAGSNTLGLVVLSGPAGSPTVSVHVPQG